jgi:hypothetical protein
MKREVWRVNIGDGIDNSFSCLFAASSPGLALHFFPVRFITLDPMVRLISRYSGNSLVSTALSYTE